MTLSALIRKRDTGNLATAIPAISATQPKGEAATVARIATVAVANPKERRTDAVATEPFPPTIRRPSAPMAAEAGTAIRAWLALIKETDPTTIAEAIGQCQQDADSRDYFTWRAAAELPEPDPFPDDRRTCGQCTNLVFRQCQAAKRGEIVASRNYEPISDLPRRCEAYMPGADDLDRRPGAERWPELIQQGDD